MGPLNLSLPAAFKQYLECMRVANKSTQSSSNMRCTVLWIKHTKSQWGAWSSETSVQKVRTLDVHEYTSVWHSLITEACTINFPSLTRVCSLHFAHGVKFTDLWGRVKRDVSTPMTSHSQHTHSLLAIQALFRLDINICLVWSNYWWEFCLFSHTIVIFFSNRTKFAIFWLESLILSLTTIGLHVKHAPAVEGKAHSMKAA